MDEMGRIGWFRAGLLMAGVLSLAALATACGDDSGTAGDGQQRITLYAGRNEALVQPVLDQFTAATGIQVDVRYVETTAAATAILEEGNNGRWDVYWSQDAGALGAVESAGLFQELPAEILGPVPAVYRSANEYWVATSGRVRVVAYNTDRINPEADLPDSILDFTDPQWRGRIGWAPTNASFQSFITAMRVHLGEDAARAWVEGIQANNPTVYANNTAILQGVADGEVDVGFTNHYYLFRFLAEHGDAFKARNYYTAPGDVGTLVNIAGAGIFRGTSAPDEARALVAYLLSDEAQAFFAEQVNEYPVVAGVPAGLDLPSLAELEPVDLDLTRLSDLRGTVTLLQDTGVLP
jgi:iron(III) transport system substrate-binding protein